MVSRLTFSCVVCALIGTAAYGQQTELPSAATPSPATSVVYATQDDVIALQSEIAALRQQLTAKVRPMDLETDVDQTPNSFEERLAAVERTQQELLRLGHSQGLVIEQIAARDDRGQYYPVFRGNSEQARESLSQAIDSTVPEHGVIVVANYTRSDQWIMINGDQYRIRARRMRDIPTSPGNVTTKISGESQKSWHLGPGNRYSQAIDLRERPISRYVYNAAPLYAESGGLAVAY